jgi:hypothetical protein
MKIILMGSITLRKQKFINFIVAKHRMPFKSEAQRRACWAQYNRDLKAGKTPTWNCYEWEGATRYHFYGNKKYIIREGPRGGKFILVNGSKKYIR